MANPGWMGQVVGQSGVFYTRRHINIHVYKYMYIYTQMCMYTYAFQFA